MVADRGGAHPRRGDAVLPSAKKVCILPPISIGILQAAIFRSAIVMIPTKLFRKRNGGT